MFLVFSKDDKATKTKKVSRKNDGISHSFKFTSMVHDEITRDESALLHYLLKNAFFPGKILLLTPFSTFVYALYLLVSKDLFCLFSKFFCSKLGG